MKRIPILCAALIIIITVASSILVFAVGPENIAADAAISAPECNGINSVSFLCDGKYPKSSFDTVADGYSSHDYAGGFTSSEGYVVYDNVELITFTWDCEVTVDSIGMYFLCSAPERQAWFMIGGNDTPAYYTVEYLFGGEYVAVTGAAGFGVKRDVMNVTEFEAVTTTSLRITMYKLSDAEIAEYVDKYVAEQSATGNTVNSGFVYRSLGIGVAEIEIYEATPIETESTSETESDETTEKVDDDKTETSKKETSRREEETATKPETTTREEETTLAPETETETEIEIVTETETETETELDIDTPAVDETDEIETNVTETNVTDTESATVESGTDVTDADATAPETDTAETLYLNDGSAIDTDADEGDSTKFPWGIFIITLVVTVAVVVLIFVFKK